MNLKILTAENITQFAPNILREVTGETPFSEKLAPFIASAKAWLEAEYLGPDDFLSPEENKVAVRVVVTKAYADALPSLDIVVTPTGIGVVNTDTIAPASKERVERLVKSLRDILHDNLTLLVDLCHKYPAWRESEPGRFFCATFLSSLLDLRAMPEGVTFEDMRLKALIVEQKMADRFLGHNLMASMRDAENARREAGSPQEALCRSLCKKAVAALVAAPGPVPHYNAIWEECSHVINAVDDCPEYLEIWTAEMRGVLTKPFDNNIKGSYYF